MQESNCGDFLNIINCQNLSKRLWALCRFLWQVTAKHIHMYRWTKRHYKGVSHDLMRLSVVPLSCPQLEKSQQNQRSLCRMPDCSINGCSGWLVLRWIVHNTKYRFASNFNYWPLALPLQRVLHRRHNRLWLDSRHHASRGIFLRHIRLLQITPLECQNFLPNRQFLQL